MDIELYFTICGNKELNDGKIYFTKPAHICKFLRNGTFLKQVYLSSNNSKQDLVHDYKYSGNILMIDKGYDLTKVETWQYMESMCINIVDDINVIEWVFMYGHVNIMEYLLSIGTNFKKYNHHAMRISFKYGNDRSIDFLKSRVYDITSHEYIDNFGPITSTKLNSYHKSKTITKLSNDLAIERIKEMIITNNQNVQTI
ncbi:putative ankyrin repeat protein [Megavirus lba]|uniref:Putative ankyrin repeat protein n=1 Tax=Megavirus lba TaxID=1235314 RepID=L7Y2K6_9VIRU|nr:putative ankyrin repeat protein [Megavirus lba]